ncbi:MAG: Dyp-type peroxidase [Bacteroidia bacterium]|nr:Dyp-type peroxidase [Bacteroidia bacterium]
MAYEKAQESGLNRNVRPIEKPYLEGLDTLDILNQVQGNIFESHKREFVICLFFHFGDNLSKDEKSNIQNTISEFSQKITSAKQILSERLDYGKERKKKVFDLEHIDKFLKSKPNVYFLYLSGLGFKKTKNNRLIDKFPDDKTFLKGMSSSGNKTAVNDHIPGSKSKNPWLKYAWRREKKVDMLIQLAGDDSSKLEEEAMKITNYWGRKCSVKFLFAERGRMIYHNGNRRDAREPFGFRDGLSKIPFWEKNGKELLEKSREIVLDDHLGSYMVFRKLEQDVARFEWMVEDLTYKIFGLKKYQKGFEEKKAFVEAQIFGRFRDGTPLELYDHPIMDHQNQHIESILKIKNFNKYKPVEDRDGFDGDSRCPYFSHIRKTNPRSKAQITQNGTEYKEGKKFNMRIARRGIPYKEINHKGEEKVGLLFMGYQANVSTQFKEMKIKWSNDPDFEQEKTGYDPIIGRPFEEGELYPYKWILDWNTKEVKEVPYSFEGIIKLKGGEYFYAPSIPFLEGLGMRQNEVEEGRLS